jgi:RNA polymerase sigma-70 factor (family 1)
MSHMHKFDERNLKLLQKSVAFDRDVHSYKQIFFAFYKHLLRFANSICKNPEASEEVTADVLVRVWTMKEELAKVENLKIYLFVAIKNASLNYLSRNKKYTSWDINYVDIELDSNLYNPEDTAITRELRRDIIAAVKMLPPKCQMVYKLIREDGLTYKEVSGIMGISENTVDRHLMIALRKLADALKLHLKR